MSHHGYRDSGGGGDLQQLEDCSPKKQQGSFSPRERSSSSGQGTHVFSRVFGYGTHISSDESGGGARHLGMKGGLLRSSTARRRVICATAAAAAIACGFVTGNSLTAAGVPPRAASNTAVNGIVSDSLGETSVKTHGGNHQPWRHHEEGQHHQSQSPRDHDGRRQDDVTPHISFDVWDAPQRRDPQQQPDQLQSAASRSNAENPSSRAARAYPAGISATEHETRGLTGETFTYPYVSRSDLITAEVDERRDHNVGQDADDHISRDTRDTTVRSGAGIADDYNDHTQTRRLLIETLIYEDEKDAEEHAQKLENADGRSGPSTAVSAAPEADVGRRTMKRRLTSLFDVRTDGQEEEGDVESERAYRDATLGVGGGGAEEGRGGESKSVRGNDDGHDEPSLCSPLKVTGLDRCPELEGKIVEKMLLAKRDMLRQVVEVLTDPATAGHSEGNVDEPLLLVQQLSVDEADAAFGAFESKYRGLATDAAGWNPEPGGLNRWVERYYNEVLHRSRPVIITVHGDDVCAVENELFRDARIAAAGIETEEEMAAAEREGRLPGEGENFDIPVVLMTLGWDPAGDPTHREDGLGRDRACVYRILKKDRIATWFTSHTRYDSHTNEKFTYIPIGYGGYETRNGLPQTYYVEIAKKKLEVLEKCPIDQTGEFDLLFQGNTLERSPRERIWHDMTDKETGPIPVNRAPLESVDMVAAYSRGIFAVSPPGTGPDCFRSYELMLMGDMTLVQETYSVRQFMKYLPAFVMGPKGIVDWRELTCNVLKEMAETTQAMIQEGKNGGKGMQFEKLTHNFWRNFIRRETVKKGGGDPDAPYIERSAEPLVEPGWKTFRRLGCFSRKNIKNSRIPEARRFILDREERSPEGCAAKCSWKKGGGIGFFGIQDGSRCWCDKEPGGAVAEEECDIPCHDQDGTESCGGQDSSTVFVFGPEEQPEFQYMGCFYNSERVMYHAEVKLRNSNTPFMCEALCTSLRYPYFSLEKSVWCRCGVMPYDTPRSVRDPAYVSEFQDTERGPPDVALAGRPLPGVRIGDHRFQCHKGRCAGDSAMWGCGSMSAYDLYKVTNMCAVYRDC